LQQFGCDVVDAHWSDVEDGQTNREKDLTLARLGKTSGHGAAPPTMPIRIECNPARRPSTAKHSPRRLNSFTLQCSHHSSLHNDSRQPRTPTSQDVYAMHLPLITMRHATNNLSNSFLRRSRQYVTSAFPDYIPWFWRSWVAANMRLQSSSSSSTTRPSTPTAPHFPHSTYVIHQNSHMTED
jgi:hypothetical protein